MTCFFTHFPLSVLSLFTLFVVLATITAVNILAAKRPRLQTVNLTTAPTQVRHNLRRIR